MLGRLDRVLDGLTMAAKWAMVTMAALIFVIICVTVFTRYLLNFVPSWSEEVPRYLLVWMSYLGAALAVRYKEHISLDVFFNLLPEGVRRAGRLILNGLIAVVGLVMVVFGLGLLRQFGDDLMESIPVTNFWLYLATPVSGSLIVLYVVRDQITVLTRRREEVSPPSEVIPV